MITNLARAKRCERNRSARHALDHSVTPFDCLVVKNLVFCITSMIPYMVRRERGNCESSSVP
jgi:hypothetical protein